MAETSETNFEEFKGKYRVFVTDWLKTKGLHKLCSVFEGVEERFISIIYKYVLGIRTKIFQKFKFPGGCLGEGC